MTDFYTQLIEKSGFDKALIRHAHDFAKKINIDEFSHLFFDTEPFCVEESGVLSFEDSFYPAKFYNALKNLALPPEKASLYIYTLLLEKSFYDFSKRIEDTRLFFDTAKRVRESAEEFYESQGDYGLYDYHFVANHVRGSIIRLHGFEYQYGVFEEKRAIILHLPEKADLTKENRLSSYRLARRYFGDLPIIGDSWLLYPLHQEMLSKDSRIVDFMGDFDIVSSEETTDYSEAFHVFGRLCDYSYNNLPQNTTLQKAYADRIKKQLPIGSGVGLLKY